MRSKLVFAAGRSLSNRYMLCRVAATITRRLHRPNTRIEETMDAVFGMIGRSQASEVMRDETIADATEQAAA